PTPGQWYNIALTKSGPQYELYVNGQAVGSATVSFPMPQIDAPLTIGASGEAFGGNFDGDLAQIGIFNRALSPAEIAQTYQKGVTAATILPVTPASFQLSTDHAGDTGPFTLSITSTGPVFENGATVTLSVAGQPSIAAVSTTVDAANTS